MSQVSDTLVAKPREAKNKSAARQVRASGWAPAVAYGPSTEPRHLALDPNVLVTARRKFGRAHVYNVDIEGGQSFKALIKQIDLDPLTRKVRHVDLYEFDPNKEIRAKVRVDLVGKAKGVTLGGILEQVMRTVEVATLPGNLPESLELDVTEMGLGDMLFASELKLPEGVEITAHDNHPVVKLSGPRGKDEDEEAAEGAAEGAAAPAAEGAAEKKAEKK